MIVIQFLLAGWAVVIFAAAVGAISTWLTNPITGRRASDRDVDQALEITRDDWHDWEREVAS